VFQNSLSYPFYILGGVAVPVAFMPGFLHPVSRILFLSWSADLLRASIRGAVPGWPGRLAIIAGLGALALAAGVRLTRVVVDRARRNATVGHA
jgi:ABC-2 type transport system permease protein